MFQKLFDFNIQARDLILNCSKFIFVNFSLISVKTCQILTFVGQESQKKVLSLS